MYSLGQQDPYTVATQIANALMSAEHEGVGLDQLVPAHMIPSFPPFVYQTLQNKVYPAGGFSDSTVERSVDIVCKDFFDWLARMGTFSPIVTDVNYYDLYSRTMSPLVSGLYQSAYVAVLAAVQPVVVSEVEEVITTPPILERLDRVGAGQIITLRPEAEIKPLGPVGIESKPEVSIEQVSLDLEKPIEEAAEEEDIMVAVDEEEPMPLIRPITSEEAVREILASTDEEKFDRPLTDEEVPTPPHVVPPMETKTPWGTLLVALGAGYVLYKLVS